MAGAALAPARLAAAVARRHPSRMAVAHQTPEGRRRSGRPVRPCGRRASPRALVAPSRQETGNVDPGHPLRLAPDGAQAGIHARRRADARPRHRRQREHVQLGGWPDAPPARQREAAGPPRRAQRHDPHPRRAEPLLPRLRGLPPAPARERRRSHRLHDGADEHARGQWRSAARVRGDGLGQLLRGAWRPAVARPRVPPGRRLGPQSLSGRGDQPQLLDAPVRRRPVDRRTDDHTQLARLHGDRRRARRLSRHPAVPEPRSLGAADDAAGAGRRSTPPAQQPLAPGDRASAAGRPPRPRRSRPEPDRQGSRRHLCRRCRQRGQAVRAVARPEHGRRGRHGGDGRTARRRRGRAVDRVRERREPAAGERRHAPARDRGAADTGRQPHPPGAADADREQPPRDRGRPGRHPVRLLDEGSRASVRAAGAAADRDQPPVERRRDALRSRRHAGDRGAVRPRPGAAGRGLVGDDGVEGLGDRGHRDAAARPHPQGAGRRAGGAVAGAAGVGRSVSSHADERAIGGSRLLDANRPGRRDRSAAGRLRCNPRPGVLPRHAGKGARDSGRRGGEPGHAHDARLQRQQRHGRGDRRLHARAERGSVALLQPYRFRLPEDAGDRPGGGPGVHRAGHARAPRRGDRERDAGAPLLRGTQSDRRTHPGQRPRAPGGGGGAGRQVQQHHREASPVHVPAGAAVVSRRRRADRQDAGRSRRACPAPPCRLPRARPERAALRRQDDCRSSRNRGVRAADGRQPADRVRRARADPGNRRPLRGHCRAGGAADAGDRHADGARRLAQRHRVADLEAGARDDADGNRGRAGRRIRAHARVQEPAGRRQRHRRRQLRRDDTAPRHRGARGLLSAGAPGVSHRSAPGSAK